MGLSHADITYLAFAGHLRGLRDRDGEPRPFSRLRGMAMLQSQRVHLVVAARSGIRGVSDLRRRRVSVGPGSGRTSTAGIVLDAFEVGPPAADVRGLPYADAAARLADGTLDAFFVTGSGPLEAVTSATRAGARLVPLDGPVIDWLCRDYPFFRRVVIPGGLYPGHPDPIHTIGVDSVLICRVDLEESLVYDLTRQLFEILPSLSPSTWPRGPMDIEQAPATPIPLHEGAARYYREQELSR